MAFVAFCSMRSLYWLSAYIEAQALQLSLSRSWGAYARRRFGLFASEGLSLKSFGLAVTNGFLYRLGERLGKGGVWRGDRGISKG